jgi:hypothetical protein
LVDLIDKNSSDMQAQQAGCNSDDEARDVVFAD